LRKRGSDPEGFELIYRQVGLYNSPLCWLRKQEALAVLSENVLEILADYRESLGKGRLLT
jgi:hypothetical protein